MDAPTLPFSKDLVLIGGGHTHALVLQKWAMTPLPGTRVTLINPGPTAPYSGMLPGHVAGHYGLDELNIDLVRLARRAGARLVMAPAEGIDRTQRTIRVKGYPDIGFDVASVDIGITSAMPGLPGFTEHGVPAKPLGPFAAVWEAFAQGNKPARIVVIGGGVAGAELAMAMAYRLRKAERPAEVTLLDQALAFSALGTPAGARLRQALKRQGVTLLENTKPVEVSKDGIVLHDGHTLEADFVTGAAGAKPHDWLRSTGLTNDAGFVPVDQYLNSKDAAIFAVGDCAEMTANPRPKAGVYAVRQAPVLFHNLRTALSASGKLRQYHPQRDYLKLISLGEKSALAERFGMPVSGPLFWRWKDHIDRTFMAKFESASKTPVAPLPQPRAEGSAEVLGPKPMCGGCGAKIGQSALNRALSSVGTDNLSDDAAILQTGQAQQVISTDHLRAMTGDPVTLARIAAAHALGDIWAMGAEPQAALASIILPRQSPELAERCLKEIMKAAQETMHAAGAEIVGGHSTQGAELTIGFTVTGLCNTKPITLKGVRPGDHLILTKPLGSGVIMAAEMEGVAKGEHVAKALELMMQPQGTAARHLAPASAMTDVTGFGLAGHLLNMARASGIGAEIAVDDLPLMPGALELSEKGIRSTLYSENREPFAHVIETPHNALLFDPQTSGGLLAAISGDPVPVVAALRDDGYDAAVIGQITDHSGQVDIL